jgi:hypothetical protein
MPIHSPKIFGDLAGLHSLPEGAQRYLQSLVDLSTCLFLIQAGPRAWRYHTSSGAVYGFDPQTQIVESPLS